MAQTLSSAGPLKGTVELPGDPRIALSALAFGMFASGSITLKNVPDSSQIESFCSFLTDLGAHVEISGDICIVNFTELPSRIDIDHRVPDMVLHQVIAGSVFTADRTIIRDGAANRERITGQCLRLLAPAGLRSTRISHEGDDLVIPHTSFDPDGIDEVRNGWELETLLTASCAVGRPVRVAYPPPLCAQPLKLTVFLGCKGSAIDATGSVDRDLELTRRLARSRGTRAYQTSIFEWNSVSDQTLLLPGDMTLAAALGVCAVMNQRSRLTLRNVVWEQDRRGLLDTLKRMKAPVSWTPSKKIQPFETADIAVKWGPLEGVQVTAEQSVTMIGELLLLAVAASCATGTTVVSTESSMPLIDRERFRILASNLDRMGVHVGDFTDGIVLNGVPELRGASIDAGSDESLAIALACASATAAATSTLDGIPEHSPRLTLFFNLLESVSDPSLSLS